MSFSEGMPPSWVLSTIGEICKLRAGYGFPERFQGKSEGEIPFFKVGDISEAWKRGEIYLQRANHYVTSSEVDELRAALLPADTTVFAKIGAAIGLNRRAMLTEPALIDNNVMGLCPTSDVIDPKYLFYFACTLKLMELAKATTVPSVRSTEIFPLKLPLAPREEQKRVVAEIEKQFTRLDDAVAALKRVQANLKRYRASVLKAACEGRLVPTEAELARKEGRSYEPASELLKRILAERRAKWESDQLQKMIAAGKPPKSDEWKMKYKEPMDVQVPGLSQLAEGWTWATADQLCTQITDGEHIQPPYQQSGLPLLTAMHVRDGSVEFRDYGLISEKAFGTALQRCAPESGDVLIVSVGATTGRAAIVQQGLEPFAIVRSVLMLKTVESINAIYLLSWVRSPWCQEWIKTASGASAQPHFYISDTKRMPVPVPPHTEGKRIADECQRRLSLLEAVEKAVTAELTRASQARQSILRSAFSGKLVPQDPNDEPASVLLERIRAERAALATNNGNQRATSQAGTINGQRRRRVTRLAHRVSGGKGVGK